MSLEAIMMVLIFMALVDILALLIDILKEAKLE